MWKDTRRMSKKHTESTCNQPDLIINPRDMRRYRCVRLIEIQVKINHKHKSSVCVCVCVYDSNTHTNTNTNTFLQYMCIIIVF